MRRFGATVLLVLVASVVCVPSANAEEAFPSETASPSPGAQDLPTLDIPTGSPSQESTQSAEPSPTATTTAPTALPTEFSGSPTGSPTSTETASESPTASPSGGPSTSPTPPTQTPYPEAPTQPPVIAQAVTPAQAVALAAAVISPISMLTTALFGTSYTPGSTAVLPSSQPTPSSAAEEPSPSPSRTDDITLSGSDTRSDQEELPWGGLAIILLCGAAGLFGYSVARRGGPGTTGHV